MTPKKVDPIWQSIRTEATAITQREPFLASYLHSIILNHNSLEDALSYLLASKLASVTLPAISLRDLVDAAFASDHRIGKAFRADIEAVYNRDPACCNYSTPLLYFKGFQALQAYRVAHYYWNEERPALALFLQSRISEIFSVDIHPAAKIGRGVLIDHATSVVVGETAVIGNNVSMLHEVTLGGTGKESGDRHPKIHNGVLIAAGAKILGNVTIGEGAKVGGSAVVLEDVPPHTTVIGIPAKPCGRPPSAMPALDMDHRIYGGHGDGI